MGKTVLVAGSGNIGRRHIQALLTLERPLKLVIIEPDANAREKTQEILSTSKAEATVHLQESWGDAPEFVDLAIIATPTQPRRQVLETLLAATTPNFLLLEKVLFTTRRDLDECGRMLSNRQIPAAVNCGRRGFPGYNLLKRELAGLVGVSMRVTGSDWNLCSNGIHFIDLASYLLEEIPDKLSTDRLDDKPIPARHVGCIEFYGTLHGDLPSGGEFSISSLKNSNNPISIEFTHKNKKWHIEENKNQITFSIDEKIIENRFFETKFVSQMAYLYSDMMDNSSSVLPMYEDSSKQHKIFIDAIRKKLGHSLLEDLPCPIS